MSDHFTKFLCFFGSRIPQTVRSNTHRVFHFRPSGPSVAHPSQASRRAWDRSHDSKSPRFTEPGGTPWDTEPSDGHDPKIATWCCRFPTACRKNVQLNVQLNVTGDQTDPFRSTWYPQTWTERTWVSQHKEPCCQPVGQHFQVSSCNQT